MFQVGEKFPVGSSSMEKCDGSVKDALSKFQPEVLTLPPIQHSSTISTCWLINRSAKTPTTVQTDAFWRRHCKTLAKLQRVDSEDFVVDTLEQQRPKPTAKRRHATEMDAELKSFPCCNFFTHLHDSKLLSKSMSPRRTRRLYSFAAVVSSSWLELPVIGRDGDTNANWSVGNPSIAIMSKLWKETPLLTKHATHEIASSSIAFHALKMTRTLWLEWFVIEMKVWCFQSELQDLNDLWMRKQQRF